MAEGPVPHSLRCRQRDDTTCDRCRREAYLDQFPLSEWETQGKIYDRRRAELPRPLPEAFLVRLAAEMVAHEELFRPVVRHLAEEAAPDF